MAHPTFSGHHGVNLSALFSSAPHTVLQNLPTSVIKEGLVTKQGGRIKTWKVRWCVLDENGLRYYKIDQDIKVHYLFFFEFIKNLLFLKNIYI